jgi:hypothetical protein
VTVQLMTNHLPCGEEVVIDVDEHTPKHEIMRQLEQATTIPVEHQILRLGGLDSIFVGDKRTNIKSKVSCGSASSIKFVTLAAAEKKK